ncbi:hypothetical protein L208DRAFT_1299067 [Tricholoma matsutake]|nr:hypothetical protein L208DRAFT_1299067 [Tricholoma matsutake 945]
MNDPWECCTPWGALTYIYNLNLSLGNLLLNGSDFVSSCLCSLSGMRIVIDGMLIMQHFHFAPWQTPHCHCHVLGWYRLINELNDANVSTICIFDGKEHSSAKGPEVEHRKEVRRLTVAHGLLESNCLTQLHGLLDVLYKCHRLDIIAWEQAMELLHFYDKYTLIATFHCPLYPNLLPAYKLKTRLDCSLNI